MSPSPGAVALAALLALSLAVLPVSVVVFGAVVLAAVVVVDALAARRPPLLHRQVPGSLARGVAAPMAADVTPAGASSVQVRQPLVPDVSIDPAEHGGTQTMAVVATRRGHHVLPPIAVRATGPLHLGRWDHTLGTDESIHVYPDLPNARRIATAVRQGRFHDPGERRRGPLGLGTEFETIRDYQPDDDVRQINWVATAREGRPMSNQFRQDTERDVLGVVDAGRLMTSPVLDRTRLDAALDALVAVAAVADVLGDRCGAIAFDNQVRRRVRPRRAGGEAVVRTFHDLEPSSVDSDYELAFRSLGTTKRSLVIVFTDLLEEAAARPLLEAVPTLVRRHAVIVATSSDPELDAMVATEPRKVSDVYVAAVATEVLAGRNAVAADLARTGAVVIDANPDNLAARCVGAYLRLKSQARV
jgi:uncharacterized protein (DUF58 family)